MPAERAQLADLLELVEEVLEGEPPLHHALGRLG